MGVRQLGHKLFMVHDCNNRREGRRCWCDGDCRRRLRRRCRCATTTGCKSHSCKQVL